MPDKIHSILINSCIGHLTENLRRINICLKEVDENEFWLKPNKSSNSIGNLILHLNGNITQYILSSIGGQKDIRDRESEFDNQNRFSMEQLLNDHDRVIEKAILIIKT